MLPDPCVRVLRAEAALGRAGAPRVRGGRGGGGGARGGGGPPPPTAGGGPPRQHSDRGESPGSQRYIGPKFWQARKSAPSGDSVPNSDHALGRKTRSSGTLCMLTGMRSMDARVISWPPMWP